MKFVETKKGWATPKKTVKYGCRIKYGCRVIWFDELVLLERKGSSAKRKGARFASEWLLAGQGLLVAGSH
jgi:hypothetical protein